MATNVQERFDAKYEVEPTTGCWLWTAAAFPDGYGAFRAGREQRAHRVAYIMEHGPIAPGLYVLHRCDTPLCVNPAHLFLGTQADNIADAKAKGRRAPQHGAHAGNAKLTEEQVREIRRRAGTTSQAALGREFGVHQVTINNVLSGKHWRTTTQEAN